MWESRRLFIILEEKTYWLAYSFTCYMIFPGGRAVQSKSHAKIS
jgi:hypothetical protein